MVDSLYEIFKRQDLLNKNTNSKYKDFLKLEKSSYLECDDSGDMKSQADKIKGELIREYSLALQMELAELIDSTPWKWWKKMAFNEKNAKVEAVDCLHFLVSIFLILDMTPEDVFLLYNKKNQLNLDRSSGGYAAGAYVKFIDGVEDNDRL